MKIKTFPFCRAAALALLLTATGPAAAEILPTPHPLPPLPGDDGGMALAINNKGEAAGVSIGAKDLTEQTAVKWDRKGVPTALPPLPGDTASWGLSINWRGEVAGSSTDDPFSDLAGTAVRWDATGQPHRLAPLPGDVASFGRGINKAGLVAGTSVDADGRKTAVIWDRAGQPRVLPGGSEAVGVNNAGEAVGDLMVWDGDGVRRDLTVPAGSCIDEAASESITWRGETAGTAATAEGYCTAVRWSPAGEPELLEVPYLETKPGVFEFFDAMGHGIEASGEVVGETAYGVGGVWDRSGDFIPLPTPDGSFANGAFAINIRGEIAGYSIGPGLISGDHTWLPVVWR